MKRQVFPIIGTIITLAQQSSICESYVFVIVVGRASAILYNLVAMWPLCLAFMLTSKVCKDDKYETIVFFVVLLQRICVRLNSSMLRLPVLGKKAFLNT